MKRYNKVILFKILTTSYLQLEQDFISIYMYILLKLRKWHSTLNYAHGVHLVTGLHLLALMEITNYLS